MKIIKSARVRAGLTQRELAAAAGMSQPALARIEAGRVVPRLDTVTTLLHECGMRLEAVPRAGVGIDRSTIREMLRLSPARRLEIATQEARNMAALLRK